MTESGLTATDLIAALYADPQFLALSPPEKAEQLRGLLENGGKPPEPAAVDPEPVEGPVQDAGEGYAELGEFLEDTLRLSVGGVHYDLPACDIDTGLECQRLWNMSTKVARGGSLTERQRAELDDEQERDLYERLLGGQKAFDDGTPNPRYSPERDIWNRLKAEGKPWTFVAHMGRTAFIWAALDQESALAFWKSGGQAPKAQPRQPTDRLPAKTTSTRTSGPRKRTPSAGRRSSKAGGT